MHPSSDSKAVDDSQGKKGTKGKKIAMTQKDSKESKASPSAAPTSTNRSRNFFANWMSKPQIPEPSQFNKEYSRQEVVQEVSAVEAPSNALDAMQNTVNVSDFHAPPVTTEVKQVDQALDKEDEQTERAKESRVIQGIENASALTTEFTAMSMDEDETSLAKEKEPIVVPVDTSTLNLPMTQIPATAEIVHSTNGTQGEVQTMHPESVGNHMPPTATSSAHEPPSPRVSPARVSSSTSHPPSPIAAPQHSQAIQIASSPPATLSTLEPAAFSTHSTPLLPPSRSPPTTANHMAYAAFASETPCAYIPDLLWLRSRILTEANEQNLDKSVLDAILQLWTRHLQSISSEMAKTSQPAKQSTSNGGKAGAKSGSLLEFTARTRAAEAEAKAAMRLDLDSGKAMTYTADLHRKIVALLQRIVPSYQPAVAVLHSQMDFGSLLKVLRSPLWQDKVDQLVESYYNETNKDIHVRNTSDASDSNKSISTTYDCWPPYWNTADFHSANSFGSSSHLHNGPSNEAATTAPTNDTQLFQDFFSVSRTAVWHRLCSYMCRKYVCEAPTHSVAGVESISTPAFLSADDIAGKDSEHSGPSVSLISSFDAVANGASSTSPAVSSALASFRHKDTAVAVSHESTMILDVDTECNDRSNSGAFSTLTHLPVRIRADAQHPLSHIPIPSDLVHSNGASNGTSIPRHISGHAAFAAPYSTKVHLRSSFGDASFPSRYRPKRVYEILGRGNRVVACSLFNWLWTWDCRLRRKAQKDPKLAYLSATEALNKNKSSGREVSDHTEAIDVSHDGPSSGGYSNGNTQARHQDDGPSTASKVPTPSSKLGVSSTIEQRNAGYESAYSSEDSLNDYHYSSDEFTDGEEFDDWDDEDEEDLRPSSRRKPTRLRKNTSARASRKQGRSQRSSGRSSVTQQQQRLSGSKRSRQPMRSFFGGSSSTTTMSSNANLSAGGGNSNSRSTFGASGTPPPVQVAYIWGPSGSGKLDAVYCVAGNLGYKVLEVHAGTLRNRHMLLGLLREATQSHRLQWDSSNKEPKTTAASGASAASSSFSKMHEPSASSVTPAKNESSPPQKRQPKRLRASTASPSSIVGSPSQSSPQPPTSAATLRSFFGGAATKRSANADAKSPKTAIDSATMPPSSPIVIEAVTPEPKTEQQGIGRFFTKTPRLATDTNTNTNATLSAPMHAAAPVVTAPSTHDSLLDHEIHALHRSGLLPTSKRARRPGVSVPSASATASPIPIPKLSTRPVASSPLPPLSPNSVGEPFEEDGNTSKAANMREDESSPQGSVSRASAIVSLDASNQDHSQSPPLQWDTDALKAVQDGKTFRVRLSLHDGEQNMENRGTRATRASSAVAPLSPEVQILSDSMVLDTPVTPITPVTPTSAPFLSRNHHSTSQNATEYDRTISIRLSDAAKDTPASKVPPFDVDAPNEQCVDAASSAELEAEQLFLQEEGMLSTHSEHTLILISDVEIFFDQKDVGYLSAIEELIQSSKCPIILVGNSPPLPDAPFPALSMPHLPLLFLRPSLPELKLALRTIALVELSANPVGSVAEEKVSDRAIETMVDRIASESQGDVRYAYNALQVELLHQLRSMEQIVESDASGASQSRNSTEITQYHPKGNLTSSPGLLQVDAVHTAVKECSSVLRSGMCSGLFCLEQTMSSKHAKLQPKRSKQKPSASHWDPEFLVSMGLPTSWIEANDDTDSEGITDVDRAAAAPSPQQLEAYYSLCAAFLSLLRTSLQWSAAEPLLANHVLHTSSTAHTPSTPTTPSKSMKKNITSVEDHYSPNIVDLRSSSGTPYTPVSSRHTQHTPYTPESAVAIDTPLASVGSLTQASSNRPSRLASLTASIASAFAQAVTTMVSIPKAPVLPSYLSAPSTARAESEIDPHEETDECKAAELDSSFFRLLDQVSPSIDSTPSDMLSVQATSVQPQVFSLESNQPFVLEVAGAGFDGLMQENPHFYLGSIPISRYDLLNATTLRLYLPDASTLQQQLSTFVADLSSITEAPGFPTSLSHLQLPYPVGVIATTATDTTSSSSPKYRIDTSYLSVFACDLRVFRPKSNPQQLETLLSRSVFITPSSAALFSKAAATAAGVHAVFLPPMESPFPQAEEDFTAQLRNALESNDAAKTNNQDQNSHIIPDTKIPVPPVYPLGWDTAPEDTDLATALSTLLQCSSYSFDAYLPEHMGYDTGSGPGGAGRGRTARGKGRTRARGRGRIGYAALDMPSPASAAPSVDNSFFSDEAQMDAEAVDAEMVDEHGTLVTHIREEHESQMTNPAPSISPLAASPHDIPSSSTDIESFTTAHQTISTPMDVSTASYYQPATHPPLVPPSHTASIHSSQLPSLDALLLALETNSLLDLIMTPRTSMAHVRMASDHTRFPTSPLPMSLLNANAETIRSYSSHFHAEFAPLSGNGNAVSSNVEASSHSVAWANLPRNASNQTRSSSSLFSLLATPYAYNHWASTAFAGAHNLPSFVSGSQRFFSTKMAFDRPIDSTSTHTDSSLETTISQWLSPFASQGFFSELADVISLHNEENATATALSDSSATIYPSLGGVPASGGLGSTAAAASMQQRSLPFGSPTSSAFSDAGSSSANTSPVPGVSPGVSPGVDRLEATSPLFATGFSTHKRSSQSDLSTLFASQHTAQKKEPVDGGSVDTAVTAAATQSTSLLHFFSPSLSKAIQSPSGNVSSHITDISNESSEPCALGTVSAPPLQLYQRADEEKFLPTAPHTWAVLPENVTWETGVVNWVEALSLACGNAILAQNERCRGNVEHATQDSQSMFMQWGLLNLALYRNTQQRLHSIVPRMVVQSVLLSKLFRTFMPLLGLHTFGPALFPSFSASTSSVSTATTTSLLDDWSVFRHMRDLESRRMDDWICDQLRAVEFELESRGLVQSAQNALVVAPKPTESTSATPYGAANTTPQAQILRPEQQASLTVVFPESEVVQSLSSGPSTRRRTEEAHAQKAMAEQFPYLFVLQSPPVFGLYPQTHTRFHAPSIATYFASSPLPNDTDSTATHAPATHLPLFHEFLPLSRPSLNPRLTSLGRRLVESLPTDGELAYDVVLQSF